MDNPKKDLLQKLLLLRQSLAESIHSCGQNCFCPRFQVFKTADGSYDSISNFEVREPSCKCSLYKALYYVEGKFDLSDAWLTNVKPAYKQAKTVLGSKVVLTKFRQLLEEIDSYENYSPEVGASPEVFPEILIETSTEVVGQVPKFSGYDLIQNRERPFVRTRNGFPLYFKGFPHSPKFRDTGEDSRYIYALVCDFDNTIRYVGCCADLSTCKDYHRVFRKGNNSLWEWKNSVYFRFSIFELARVDKSVWRQAEREWIAYFRKFGKLYNIGRGGGK